MLIAAQTPASAVNAIAPAGSLASRVFGLVVMVVVLVSVVVPMPAAV